MSSNLTDKFISNTYTKIFQKSELPDSEGSENINLDLGLNNDSLTLVNGLNVLLNKPKSILFKFTF